MSVERCQCALAGTSLEIRHRPCLLSLDASTAVQAQVTWLQHDNPGHSRLASQSDWQTSFHWSQEATDEDWWSSEETGTWHTLLKAQLWLHGHLCYRRATCSPDSTPRYSLISCYLSWVLWLSWVPQCFLCLSNHFGLSLDYWNVFILAG